MLLQYCGSELVFSGSYFPKRPYPDPQHWHAVGAGTAVGMIVKHRRIEVT
jgi:hypothetical protein